MNRLYLLGLALLLALILPLQGGDPDKKPKSSPEGEAFQDYLAKVHSKKKWQTGPTLLDSPELKKAYPGQRFMYVYSTAPLPPGANIPEVQRNYREQVKNIRDNYLSLTAAWVKMGEEWKFTPLTKAQDYNQGLMKITDEAEARVAAAAILALVGIDQVSPRTVEAKEVKVMKTEKGWTCQVQRQNSFMGTVTFNAKGECTAVSKSYAGPYPP